MRTGGAYFALWSGRAHIARGSSRTGFSRSSCRTCFARRTDSTEIALNALRTGRPYITLWALGSSNSISAGGSSFALISFVALLSLDSLFTSRTNGALFSGDAILAHISLRTLITLSALRTGSALWSGWTDFALISFVALLALNADSISADIAFVALLANGSLNPLRASGTDFSLIALLTGFASETGSTICSGRSCGPSFSSATGGTGGALNSFRALRTDWALRTLLAVHLNDSGALIIVDILIVDDLFARH